MYVWVLDPLGVADTCGVTAAANAVVATIPTMRCRARRCLMMLMESPP
jgi:hypothetical protein